MQSSYGKSATSITEVFIDLPLERRRFPENVARLFHDRWFWYVVILAFFIGIFSFAPDLIALMGLTPRPGWDLAYYLALYRTTFVMSAAIAAWRFGIPGGIATCILLAPIIFSPFIFGLRELNIWIDLGLVGFGILVSLGIGRLGNIQRLLVKTTRELQRQATELRSEIAEREKIEEEVRTLSLRAIESLVSALEAKDKYTAGHSRRVTEIAVAIGRRMNLSADDLEALRCGSLLHDVGKIAVEQYIQNKPDKLTSDEYEHVMIHVESGADIVRPVVDRRVVELILHHHDHYDGGNPYQSLAGEAIPLGARIITVADAFDAMTSDRPYRPAMSIMAARTEIQHYIGTQFDPFVVRMFLEIPMAEVASMI